MILLNVLVLPVLIIPPRDLAPVLIVLVILIKKPLLILVPSVFKILGLILLLLILTLTVLHLSIPPRSTIFPFVKLMLKPSVFVNLSEMPVSVFMTWLMKRIVVISVNKNSDAINIVRALQVLFPNMIIIYNQ